MEYEAIEAPTTSELYLAAMANEEVRRLVMLSGVSVWAAVKIVNERNMRRAERHAELVAAEEARKAQIEAAKDEAITEETAAALIKKFERKNLNKPARARLAAQFATDADWQRFANGQTRAKAVASMTEGFALSLIDALR